MMNYLEALTEVASDKEFVEHFDRLTGSSLGTVLKSTGINKLIDEATGRKDAEINKFIDFFEEYVWSRLPPEAFFDPYNEEIEGWNNVNKNPPTEVNWYKIKTIMGEYEAPFVHNGAGNLVWVIPDQSIITHWKERAIEVKKAK